MRCAALISVLAISGIAATGIAATVAPAGAADLADSIESPQEASYAIGLILGSQLENNGLAAVISRVDLERGIDAGLAGKAPEARQRELAAGFSRAARLALAQRNTNLAREFLAKNAQRQDIHALPSGLQYRVIAPGDPQGRSPGPTDRVSVRYRATLADGRELDRSEDHDRPSVFRMNSMIPGWHEALAGMKPHARWQVFVPPDLGYGANSPPPIPPGALVIYELELLDIEAAPTLQPPARKGTAATDR